MQNFIHGFLENVYNKFLIDISSLPSLCDLKKLRFDDPNVQPNYADVTTQRLYLLRYGYAYFSEYYYLYRNIFEKNRGKNIRILSIGAGCAIDYYAAYYANLDNKVNLEYCGIDIINWVDRENIGNYQFLIEDVAKIDLSQFSRTNILIFPKSLFEFPEDVANNFFQAIQQNSFLSDSSLIISSQRPYFFNNDSNRFNTLVQSFHKLGYVKESGNVIKAPSGYTSCYHIVHFSCPDFIRPLLESLADRCKNIELCPNGYGRGICDSRDQLNRGPMFSPNLMNIEYALVKKVIK
ncbi:hypothetical protein JCM14469_26860 [Desulfatiferula olefinivorans]